MSLQESTPVGVESETVPWLQPFYGGGLDRPHDQETWREMRFGAAQDRPEIPTGFIASIGRWGLKVDSGGSGPKVNGIAWTPNRFLSVVAGGDLRGGAGLGASLSVRLRF